jgi:hypothetical protein
MSYDVFSLLVTSVSWISISCSFFPYPFYWTYFICTWFTFYWRWYFCYKCWKSYRLLYSSRWINSWLFWGYPFLSKSYFFCIIGDNYFYIFYFLTLFRVLYWLFISGKLLFCLCKNMPNWGWFCLFFSIFLIW